MTMKLRSLWNKQNKKFHTQLLGVPGPTMGKNETWATFEELTPGRCSYIYKRKKKKPLPFEGPRRKTRNKKLYIFNHHSDATKHQRQR